MYHFVKLLCIFLFVLVHMVDSSRKGTKIAVYIHAIASPLGVKIVRGYLKSMQEVKLYSSADYIYLTILGNKTMFNPTFTEYPKVTVLYHSNLLNKYEFPTLHYISKHSKEQYDNRTRILYVHTKGVNYELNLTKEHPVSVARSVNAWRKLLSYYMITKWGYSMKVMDAGYKAVGVGLRAGTTKMPVHFSGNFWWISSSLIKPLPTLQIPQEQDTQMESRYQCETWSLQGYNSPEQRLKVSTDIYCLFRYQFYYEPNTMKANPSEYRNKAQFQTIRRDGSCPY